MTRTMQILRTPTNGKYVESRPPSDVQRPAKPDATGLLDGRPKGLHYVRPQSHVQPAAVGSKDVDAIGRESQANFVARASAGPVWHHGHDPHVVCGPKMNDRRVAEWFDHVDGADERAVAWRRKRHVLRANADG